MATYIFDIDGTLTPPRQKMTDDFLSFFRQFARDYKVYLCTGSDWLKVQEQVPQEILDLVKGVFTCSGNAFWKDGKEDLTLRSNWVASSDLLEDLQGFVSRSRSPHITSRHLEQRIGMLNFSTIGRGCSQNQRENYEEWDNIEKERRHIVDVMSAKYPDLDFNIGGQISIDIHPKGNDKSRAVMLVQEWATDDVLFFGDRLFPGGNDWAVRKVLPENRTFLVDNWEDTLETLKHHELFMV